jgi:geranylgeranyl diphosphate synthase, type II
VGNLRTAQNANDAVALLASPLCTPGQQLLDENRRLINQLIRDYLDKVAVESPLYHAMVAALASPGKRFRALLVLASGDAMGASKSLLLDAALAIEMVQAHSLILDDLPCMDDAQMRRNRPALHIQFGQSMALLAASTLLTEAYGCLTRQHDAQATQRCQIVSEACGLKGIAQGQAYDLLNCDTANQMKTAPLISGALQLGLYCSGNATEYQTNAFKQFGHHLGIAYQLRDDVIDDTDVKSTAQKYAQQAADRGLTVLSHAGLDTPLLRTLVQYAVQRSF